MLAYRYSLQPSKDHRQELFSCFDCCPPPALRNGSLALDPEKQRRRLCVLPGADCSTYDWNVPTRRVWMGRGRDHANEGMTPDWATPHEPIYETGCPQSHARSPFVRSLERYYRRRDEHGGRVENPALSQCADPLVHEAIAALEAYEEAAHAEHMRLVYAEREKSSNKAGGR